MLRLLPALALATLLLPGTTPAQNAELTQAIDTLVAHRMEQQRIPGVSVLVARDGDVLLAKGYGLADVEQQVPATDRTLYRIGSITKQFTAVAILQLVDAELLDLDATLSELLPDLEGVQNQDQVTLRQLLNHTSGIPSYTNLGPRWMARVREDLSHEQLLALAEDLPPEFEPGSQWNYNNSGYYLLGMIVEQVTEQGYDRYLQEALFDGLGLESTTYGWVPTIIPGRARGYSLADGELVNAAYLSMGQPYAAGSLLSTVHDLLLWNEALHGGELLSEETYAAMIQNTVLADGSEHPYGYGLMLEPVEGHRCLSHGGDIFGFNTQLAYYPDAALHVVVLTNSDRSSPSTLEREIALRVLQEQ